MMFSEIEICDSSPCMNGGTCRQDFGKYECHCAPGYTGLNCETGWSCICVLFCSFMKTLFVNVNIF